MSGFCHIQGNSLTRKMGRKMKKQILALMTLAMASGCCVMPEAIPPCERKGQLYCYTRHAFDGEERRVRLVGWALRSLKPMFGNNNSGSWPNPGPIELLFTLGMLPVVMIDPLVVTPVIDTAFVSYDLYQKYELQSRYETCKAQIVKTPEAILSIPIEFYPADGKNIYLGGRLKRTPEFQALVDALNDESIVFPEDTLLSFVERRPWDRCHSEIALVFSRAELSSESRRKLHQRMRGCANTWGYDMGIAFYSHENTPVELVKEAQDWQESTIYFKRCVEARLQSNSQRHKP